MEKRISHQFERVSQHNTKEGKFKGERLRVSPHRKITKRDWPIGAINQLLRGRDGLVRSVEVRLPLKASQVDDDGTHKTQYKIIRRGVEHIIPL